MEQDSPDSPAKRLQKLIDALKIIPAEFARNTKIPANTISEYLSGSGAKKGFKPARLDQMREAYKDKPIDWEYMRTGLGDGPMPTVKNSKRDTLPSASGLQFIDQAALYCMQGLIISPEGLKDPVLMAKKAYTYAEAMSKVRLERQLKK